MIMRRVFWSGVVLLLVTTATTLTASQAMAGTYLTHQNYRSPKPTATFVATSTPPIQSTPTSTPTPIPLTISPTSVPNGNLCQNYSVFLTTNAGGGSSLDVWTIVSGSLPDGLAMTRSYGIESTLIYGTPTTLQTTNFTVEVQDSAGATARQAYSLTIDPPLPIQITNQSSTLAPGSVGSSYATSLFSSGGCVPFVWTVTKGQLPPGLALTQNSTGQDNNVIRGTPTTAGTFTFTATVTDKNGAQASMQFSITVS